MFKGLVFLLIMISSRIYAADFVIAEQTGTSDLTGTVTSSQKHGQTFTPLTNTRVSSVKVYSYCYSPRTVCKVNLELWTTSAGLPSAKMTGVDTVVMSMTNTELASVTFRFPSSVSLTGGVKYALVLTYFDSDIGFRGNAGGGYSGGDRVDYSGSWSTAVGDLAFSVYGSSTKASKASDVESGYYDPTMPSYIGSYLELPNVFAYTGGNWGYTAMTSSQYYERAVFKFPLGVGMQRSVTLHGYIAIPLNYTGTTPGCTVYIDIYGTTGNNYQAPRSTSILATTSKLCSAISSCQNSYNTKYCIFELPAAGVEIPVGFNVMFEVRSQGSTGLEYASLGYNTNYTSTYWESGYSSNGGSSWTQSTPVGGGYYFRFEVALPKRVFYHRVKDIVSVFFNNEIIPFQWNTTGTFPITLPIGRTDGAFASSKEASGLTIIGSQNMGIKNTGSQDSIGRTVPTFQYSLKNIP
jgi:hypothetical protein